MSEAWNLYMVPCFNILLLNLDLVFERRLCLTTNTYQMDWFAIEFTVKFSSSLQCHGINRGGETSLSLLLICHNADKLVSPTYPFISANSQSQVPQNMNGPMGGPMGGPGPMGMMPNGMMPTGVMPPGVHGGPQGNGVPPFMTQPPPWVKESKCHVYLVFIFVSTQLPKG